MNTEAMRCRLPWTSLQGRQDDIKYCDQCERTVHPVRSKAEFEAAIEQGKCVWFDSPDLKANQVVMFGGPPVAAYRSPAPLVWED